MNSKQVLMCIIAATMLGIPVAGSAVDLEPKIRFNPECSAAEKELVWTREARAKARIAFREAKMKFEACQSAVIAGKKRSCRTEERKLGAAVSRQTRANSEFKRAATHQRQVCKANIEYGGGR